MQCRNCGNPVADTFVTCPTCAERRGREGALRLQRDFIPVVLADKVALRLRRRGRTGRFHIEFFQGEGRAYCGEPLQAAHDRARCVLSAARAHQNLCEACARVLDELIAEAPAQ